MRTTISSPYMYGVNSWGKEGVWDATFRNMRSPSFSATQSHKAVHFPMPPFAAKRVQRASSVASMGDSGGHSEIKPPSTTPNTVTRHGSDRNCQAMPHQDFQCVSGSAVCCPQLPLLQSLCSNSHVQLWYIDTTNNENHISTRMQKSYKCGYKCQVTASGSAVGHALRTSLKYRITSIRKTKKTATAPRKTRCLYILQ